MTQRKGAGECFGALQMYMEEPNQSEVRRLLETIDREYQAAQLGLSGLAQGTSQHEFINARMEKIEDIREKLVDLVGEEQAAKLVVKRMEKGASDAKGL